MTTAARIDYDPERQMNRHYCPVCKADRLHRGPLIAGFYLCLTCKVLSQPYVGPSEAEQERMP